MFYIPGKFENIFRQFIDFTGISPENVQNLSGLK